MTRASTRDASFYRRPNVRSVKFYHVIAAPGMSACGRLLYDHPESHDAAADGIEAAEAPLNLRCQRPGCKSLWPSGVPTTPAAPSCDCDCDFEQEAGAMRACKTRHGTYCTASAKEVPRVR